jgi:hypothetical protein
MLRKFGQKSPICGVDIARNGLCQRAVRRGRHQREPKRRFIIYCEGAKTEPNYLAALRRSCSGALIEVETIPGAGVPFTIAESAADRSRRLGLSTKRRKALNSFEEGDQVWAVFDRDEHPRFDEAVALCKNYRVEIGRSNPCFEVWLILHEGDYDKPDGRHAVQAHLRTLRPENKPDGAKTPNCDDLVKRSEEAGRRAEAQLIRRENEGSPYGPPSTTVGRLIRAILDGAAAAGVKR